MAENFEEKIKRIIDVFGPKSEERSLENLPQSDSPRADEEKERRRLLRPHWEDHRGVEDLDVIHVRDHLDAHLQLLMAFEAAFQTGFLPAELSNQPAMLLLMIPAELRFRELCKSQAFGRYLDAYLYFGIRFFASRLNITPEKMQEDVNSAPLPLPVPPRAHTAGSESWFESLIAIHQESQGPDVQSGLKFLDGFFAKAEKPLTKMPEAEPIEQQNERPDTYWRWLWGLHPEPLPSALTKEMLLARTQGLRRWITMRVSLYKSLPCDILARLALFDFYWLAQLLGEEVSRCGIARRRNRAWVRDLFIDTSHGVERLQDPESIERILRKGFGLACDLIQEAVAISEEEERFRNCPRADLPKFEAVTWPMACDNELTEIRKQRKERLVVSEEDCGAAASEEKVREARSESRRSTWSSAAAGATAIQDLIGLAFSGGGIRSATFNLGVLEGLRNEDVLRQVDYLSTVSGGGYIGAWLVANVKRSPYWLGARVSWRASIDHLRKFSNYLAPQVGILSADTWTMAGIWSRNAFLVQLSVFAAIACLILGTRLVEYALRPWPIWRDRQVWVYLIAALALLGYSVYRIGRNVGSEQGPGSDGQGGVQGHIVAPLWVSAFFLSAVLWMISSKPPLDRIESYSGFVLSLAPWPMARWPLVVTGLCFWLLAYSSQKASSSTLRFIKGFGIAVGGLLVLYLVLCGILLLLHDWIGEPDIYRWATFVWTPSLVLISFTISIILFLGFLSGLSLDSTREWWTRLGAWLAIYGAGTVLMAVVAVYGPWVAFQAPHLKWSAIGGWAASTIGGLLAGNSGRTNGESKNRSIPNSMLNLLAMVGSLLFIAGLLILISTGLQLFFLIYSGQPATSELYWNGLNNIPLSLVGTTFGVGLACASLFAWRFDLNIFGLNNFYRNRLVRCYLGATRWTPGLRKPQRFTQFDQCDDLPLCDLQHDAPVPSGQPRFRGPFPIINCALNLGGSSDLDLHTRHSASFSMTPLHCGSNRPRVGYLKLPRPSVVGCRDENPTLGQAISISGAAASPNMGYHTSPLVAFMMTVFNVRLGWWFPNPGKRNATNWVSKGASPSFSLRYLTAELFGLAGEHSNFVNLSDGGHFENLGIYELVRRRCKIIIASDSECDPALAFEGLGNVIRLCDVDFGAEIDIEVDSIRMRAEDSRSTSHCAVGKIHYSNGTHGYLIYLKSSLTGDEDPSIEQYRSSHPTFPHESTGNQFYKEDQFESYRRLGRHVAEKAFRDIPTGSSLHTSAPQLLNLWTPVRSTDRFVEHAKALSGLWARLPNLPRLFSELFGVPVPVPAPPAAPQAETAFCFELIQLMENAFLDLQLDGFWDHPDNRGWNELFLGWARSPMLRQVWLQTKGTYGIRFQHFCRVHLGMP